jgi:hypothetical protein
MEHGETKQKPEYAQVFFWFFAFYFFLKFTGIAEWGPVRGRAAWFLNQHWSTGSDT